MSHILRDNALRDVPEGQQYEEEEERHDGEEEATRPLSSSFFFTHEEKKKKEEKKKEKGRNTRVPEDSARTNERTTRGSGRSGGRRLHRRGRAGGRTRERDARCCCLAIAAAPSSRGGLGGSRLEERAEDAVEGFCSFLQGAAVAEDTPEGPFGGVEAVVGERTSQGVWGGVVREGEFDGDVKEFGAGRGRREGDEHRRAVGDFPL
eukprot:CAMPEP_0198673036 /NCGR_PEP_ID=MMETSP1467-20131203/94285_1 /TAXON_ID=1462469 /ORGANISM="unid. sp., Strain CCMP2135" /LENGTH=205 /DNA_ID=CAMNT_0044409883 /DNA_START=19 /DNA_END=635 /DNA_ORIENTATION=-